MCILLYCCLLLCIVKQLCARYNIRETRTHGVGSEELQLHPPQHEDLTLPDGGVGSGGQLLIHIAHVNNLSGGGRRREKDSKVSSEVLSGYFLLFDCLVY